MTKQLHQKYILLVEIDLCRARVAVAKRGKSGYELNSFSENYNLDIFKAVDKCLEELKSQKVKIPKEAVLITQDATIAPLSLAVTEDHKESEIDEMVQWEMQAFMEDQLHPGAVRNALSHPGLLPPEMRSEIKEVFDEAGGDWHQQLMIRGIADDTLFGKLDSILHDRPGVDELAQTAWAKAGESPKINCMSIPDSTIAEWKNFFRARKYYLQGITARQLSCAPLIDADKIRQNNFLLVESTPDKWYVTVWKSGKIDHLKSYVGNAWEAPLTMLQDIAMDGISLICMSETPLTFSSLKRQLSEKIDYDEVAEFVPVTFSRNRWSLEGFAASLDKDNAFSCPLISTVEKLPPIYKRPLLWMTTAAILWSLFLVAYYRGHAAEIKKLQERLAFKQRSNELLQQEVNLAAVKLREAEKFKQKTASITREKEQLMRRETKSVKIYDNNFVIDLINALASSAGEEISVDVVSASSKGKFSVKGKSYSAASLQQFPNQFTSLLKDYLRSPCIINITSDQGSYSFSVSSEEGINEKK